jgi:hypothetical protein
MLLVRVCADGLRYEQKRDRGEDKLHFSGCASLATLTTTAVEQL